MITSSQIGKNGRFGNQLFQIACLVGYCLENNYELKLPKWYCELSDELFEVYFPNYLSSEDIHVSNVKYHEPFFRYQKIPNFESVDLVGYYQSYKYFEAFKDEIKKLFTPNIIVENKDESFVSLHIRRGDYKQHSNSHTNIGFDYYKKSYEFFGEEKTYLVFSDADVDECFSIIPFIKNKIYMSNNKNVCSKYIGSDKNIVLDFANMLSCKNHIVANSSFSWWAAWLSGDSVVAPKQWFTDTYSKNIGYNEEDLIPKEWIIF